MDANLRAQQWRYEFRLVTLTVVNAVPGAATQPLDLPTDEQRIRWEAWGHSRVNGEYVFEPESSTRPSAAS